LNNPGPKTTSKLLSSDSKGFSLRSTVILCVSAVAACVVFGCRQDKLDVSARPTEEFDSPRTDETNKEPSPSDQPPAADSPETDEEPITTPDQLQAALKEANPEFDGEAYIEGDLQNVAAVAINDPAVDDIGPLAGLPLMAVDLSQSAVTDISPLQGKQLRAVYLSNTDVADISPLRGAPIQELNLLRTKVRDLSPLSEMRSLQMLWLNDAPVSDISPLATVPLVSLTLAGTRVADLSPLQGHPTLERLHIARTPVTDLSVLGSLSLTRLVFTPGRIKTGMEYARNMRTVHEIGTAFGEPESGDDLMPPGVFWERYDAGDFR
jgi:hypothetical protein